MKVFFYSILLALTGITAQGQEGYGEKIVLSTDRETYLVGERVWFAASISPIEIESDTLLSKILYLELYDQQYNSIVKSKTRIHAGSSTGNITIPQETGTGNYLLRAYTNLSRNKSPYLHTTVLISIVNPQVPVSETETVTEDDILIVPEGGSLITGISSGVALRLLPGPPGFNNEITVVNDSGEIAATVCSFGNGLAFFEIAPQRERNYSLVWKNSNGNTFRKSLIVQDSGVMLNIEHDATMLDIRLVQSETGLNLSNYKIRIVSGGLNINPLFENKAVVGHKISIPLNDFKEDMVFCMLEKDGEIIDIRPVFTGHNKTSNLTLETDKQTFLQREPVKLNFNFPPGFKGSGWISAVLNNQGNINKNLIPWYVAYNPALLPGVIDQFVIHNDTLQMQLDALMILYSGIFRKEENKNSLMPTNEFLPEIRDASITGTAIYKNSRQPAQGMLVFCSVIDESNQVHIYKTGSDGKFYFTLNHLSGNQHTIYISPSQTDSIDLLINTDFEVKYPQSAGIIPFVPDSNYSEFLNKMYRNSLVNSLFPEFYENTVENKIYYPLQKTEPSKLVHLADFIEMPVMEEVFSEIVPFVTVRKRGSGYYLQIFDERIESSFDDPLVILDGIPFHDMNQLMAISTDLVKEISITNRIVHMGDHTVNGIINITTSTENFAGVKLPASSRFIEFQGVSDIFYPVFPDHSGIENKRIPDFRTLLFWSPKISPENSIVFNTSDNTGAYRITVYATDGARSYRGTKTIYVEE
jgi:hypothetical protein